MDKLEIILDAREHSLITEMLSRDLDKYKELIDIKKEQLELADVHIKYKNIFYVFERKTTTDLISSIKDGRYKEQKRRLLSNVNVSDITYIIEGDTVVSHNKHNTNILHGSYLHTMFRDNIRVVYTKNIIETATFIMILCGKILDNPDKFAKTIQQNQEVQESYTDCLKLKQKKIANIDINTCYIMQLSQIPNISNVIAKNITTIYPTYRDLIYAIDNIKADDEEQTKKERIALLTSIDKIGKEKALSILKFLSYI